MPAPPAISVLLPVRDAQDTLGEALDSLRNQTFEDFEVLVLDDGSRDGTWAVAARAAATDRRFRVLRSPGEGLVAALNTLLGEARGALVARMDGDDRCHPERLARQKAALDESPGLTGVGAQVELFRDDRPVSPNLLAYAAWLNALTTPEALFHDRFVESPLCHPSVLLRREAVVAAGGYRDGPFAEDWELWLRLLSRGHRLRCVAPVLFSWRDHQRRLTRTDPRYSAKAHVALKAEYLAPLLRGQAFTLWGAGQSGLALKRALAAHAVTPVRFIDVHPRKVGTRLEGLPVVGPADVGAPRGHLVAAVGAKGARAEIRAHLAALGWKEGADFTCAG